MEQTRNVYAKLLYKWRCYLSHRSTTCFNIHSDDVSSRATPTWIYTYDTKIVSNRFLLPSLPYELGADRFQTIEVPSREPPEAKKCFGLKIFMHFLLALSDLDHPQWKDRSSFGTIGC